MLRRLQILVAVAALAATACSSGDTTEGRAGYQLRPDSMSQGGGDPIALPDAGGGRDVAPGVDTGAPATDAGEATTDSGEATTDSGEPSVDPGTTGSPLPCRDDECEIDGACYRNGAPNPQDPCLACVVLQDDAAWSPRDETPCDDGDACTLGDRCFDGACGGTRKSCEDGDPCTTAPCDPATGDCAATPAGTPCEDGDLCTIGDACEGGACTGTPADCDDQDPCTTDACDPTTGECSHEAADGACDDGDPCTTGEQCEGGVCAGEPADCDDGDLCTIDTCVEGYGCAHHKIHNTCADENPCTDERCDPELGCVVEANTEACDDGDACTEEDMCTGGACRGAPVDLDDGNPCTNDVCDPEDGVAHEPNEEPCEDGDICTLEDFCETGECRPGPDRLPCDDGDQCTSDSCVPNEGCANLLVDWVCDDGDACTENDRCAAGECAGKPLSCDDLNDCTADSCDPETGCRNALIVANACRPDIAVDYPPRAATVLGDGSLEVTVSGTVTSGAGPIVSFFVADEPVELDEQGRFQVPVGTTVGGSPLTFSAEDAIGGARERVQAYLWSPAYLLPKADVPGSGMADPGVGVFLGQQAIDDGDRSLPPDDLATIFEMVLADYKLSEVLPEDKPAGTVAGTDIYITNLEDKSRTVTLECKDGSLLMTATLTDITGDVRTDPPFGQPRHGPLVATALVITADVVATVEEHQLKVDMMNTAVDLQGLDITLKDAGWLVNLIIDLVIPGYTRTLETQLAADLEPELEPILQDAFASLAFSEELEVPSFDPDGEPITVGLETDFSSVTFSEAGATFRLRTRVVGPEVAPYENLGLPRRMGCAVANQLLVIPQDQAFEMVLSDNLLNQIFFAAWKGGMLEIPLPAELLAEVDLDSYGVTKLEGTISGMLAPTLSDCAGRGLELVVGDLRIDLDLEIFGSPGRAVLYVTFATEILLELAEGTVGLSLGELVSMDVEVAADDTLIGAEGFLKEMIGDAVGPLLTEGLGGGTMAGFPLPRVDLSETVEGLPPGTGIGIDPQVLTRDGGNTIVGGELQ